MSIMRFRAVSAALLGLAVASPVLAQSKDEKRTVLYAEGLAGQVVAAIPLTLVLRDTTVRDPALPAERLALARWADSLVGDALLVGAPSVNWVLSPELRRLARRSAGLVPEPERMGQAVMRARNLEKVPDPLRSSLRTLMAMAGGRHAFIPAALTLTRDAEGALRATLAAVLVDARLGQVLWRGEGVGSGPGGAAAIQAAVAALLPPPSGP